MYRELYGPEPVGTVIIKCMAKMSKLSFLNFIFLFKVFHDLLGLTFFLFWVLDFSKPAYCAGTGSVVFAVNVGDILLVIVTHDTLKFGFLS